MWCFVQRLRLHSMFIVSDLMTFCSMSQICKVSDKDPRLSCLDHVVWYVINQATIAVQAFMAFAISTPLQEYFSFICSAIIFWASPLRSSSWRRLLLSGSPSNLSPIENSWSWLAEMFGCSWQIHQHSLPHQNICHRPVHSSFLHQPLRLQCNLLLKQTPIFGPTAFRSSWQWQEPRPLGPSWTSGCGSISGNDYDALLACKFSIMMVVGESGDKNDNFHPTMASPSPFEASTPGQSTWKDFCLRNISTFATFEAIWQAFDKLKWRRNHIWEKLFSAVDDNAHLCFRWGRPKLDQEKKLLDILLDNIL